MQTTRTAILGLVAALVPACSGSSGSSAATASLESFEVSDSNPTLGDAVLFTWNLAGAQAGGFDCRLDVDGDGFFEYSFADCQGPQSQAHVYANGGPERPRLSVFRQGVLVVEAGLALVVAGPAIAIMSPQRGALAKNELQVRTEVASSTPVDRVLATVEGLSVVLERIPATNEYIGVLDLASLSQGSKQLVVEATDEGGLVARIESGFLLDDGPTLLAATPRPGEVATPFVALQALCRDSLATDCVLSFQIDPDGDGIFEERARSEGVLSTLIGLASYDGRTFPSRFVGTDEFGQTTSAERRLFVDMSAGIGVLRRFAGPILDANEAAALILVQAGGVQGLRFVPDDSEDPFEIFPPPGFRLRPELAFLTSTGMLFAATEVETDVVHLFDARASTSSDLGPVDTPASILVAGDYAVWNRGLSLFRRRFSTEEVKLVNANASPLGGTVDAEGKVAWADATDGQLYGQDAFGMRMFTQEPDVLHGRLISDVVRVAFTKIRETPEGREYATAIYRRSQKVLRDFGPEEPFPGRDYQVAGGWVAFTRIGNGSQSEVWLRSPDNLETFIGPGTVDALSAQGELTWIDAGRRFLRRGDGSIEETNSSLGQAFFADGAWLIRMGNTLFAVL